MSIPVLIQVHEEVRRLSIAGSVVAGGDFRLKKLIPPLEQAGQKATVFAKVAQAATRLVEAPEADSAEALLELSTLVNAILYTQGETGRAGTLAPLPSNDLGLPPTRASARMLKPLLVSLSTTGAGRVELIREAQSRGAFRDLRLITPALGALDDPYPEIADFIATEVLPLYGSAIVPDLREQLDVKGRGGHVRRLVLLHQLDPEGSRDLVKRALDEGSKEVKVAAIACLGSSPEDLAFLLEQSKSKARHVREAALQALGKCAGDEAAARLCAALRGADLALATEPARRSRHPLVLQCLLEVAQTLLDRLLTPRDPAADKTKAAAASAEWAGDLLRVFSALGDREDEAAVAFLIDVFARRDKLASTIKGSPGGQDITNHLAWVMAWGNVPLRKALVVAHLGPSLAQPASPHLAAALVAARRSLAPAEVYDLFAPVFQTLATPKKKAALLEALQEGLLRGNAWDWQWQWQRHGLHESGASDMLSKQVLDPRWLDLAVALHHLDLVQALARPGHLKANRLLDELFQEQLKKSRSAYNVQEVLRTMARVEHPGITDAVLMTIKRYAKSTSTYELYGLSSVIPELPKAARPALETLLPTLPERVIDLLADAVAELKGRP